MAEDTIERSGVEAPFPAYPLLELRRLDLNSATPAELEALPQLKGHGVEIIRYREERGRFTELRQLAEVTGLAGNPVLQLV